MTVSVSLILSPSLSPCAVVLTLMTLSSVHCAGDNPPCGHTFSPIQLPPGVNEVACCSGRNATEIEEKNEKEIKRSVPV